MRRPSGRTAVLAAAIGILGAGCSSGADAPTETSVTVESSTTLPPSTSAPVTSTTAPPTNVAPTTTTTTVPPLDLSTIEWSQVTGQEAAFGGEGDRWIRAVVAGGPGLVAVGSERIEGDYDAAVWWSADGVAWNRVPHDEDIFGGMDAQEMESVTVGDSGLVAAGYDQSRGDDDAAFWTSIDGMTWTRVPHDEAVLGGEETQNVEQVIAGGPGFVAVGFDRSGAAGDREAAVWWSEDGVGWHQVDDVASLGGPENQMMRSVTVGGPGLVAAGYDDNADEGGAAAVWWSTDGIVWHRVPHDDAVFGGPGHQHIWWVIPTEYGLVGAGFETSDGDDAAVWISPDGMEWSRVSDDDGVLGGPGDQRITSLVSSGPWVLATGFDVGTGEDIRAVWWSADGSTWHAATTDPVALDRDTFRPGSVIRFGDQLVAVGAVRSADGIDGAVWFGSPAGS